MNLFKRATSRLKSILKSVGHFIAKVYKWLHKHASWNWLLAIIVITTVSMNLWDVYQGQDLEEMRATAFFGWFYAVITIILLAITSYGYAEIRKLFHETVKDNTSLSIEVLKLQTQLDTERKFYEQEKSHPQSGKVGTKH